MSKMPLIAWIGGGAVALCIAIMGGLYWLGTQPQSAPVVGTSTPSTPSTLCPKGTWKAQKWEETSLKHFKKNTILYMGAGDCKTYAGELYQDAGEFVIVKMPSGKGEGKKKTAILRQTWVEGVTNYDTKDPLPQAP